MSEQDIKFTEYGETVPGCIRAVEPKCPFVAVIPSITVDDRSGLNKLADCFVHVANINTTYYIDDKKRITKTWAGPVEYSNYDLDANTLNLRNQFLIDKTNDVAAYFDKTGKYQLIGEKKPLEITLTPADFSEWTDFYGAFLSNLPKSITMTRITSADGAEYTAEDLFNFLEAGDQIILDGAGIGFQFSTGSEYGGLIYPGVSIKAQPAYRYEMDIDEGHIVFWTDGILQIQYTNTSQTSASGYVATNVNFVGNMALYELTPVDGSEVVFGIAFAGEDRTPQQ